MVQAICPNGTLRIIQIGGWVNHNIPAHKVLVRNRFGEYIPGILLSIFDRYRRGVYTLWNMRMRRLAAHMRCVVRELSSSVRFCKNIPVATLPWSTHKIRNFISYPN